MNKRQQPEYEPITVTLPTWYDDENKTAYANMCPKHLMEKNDALEDLLTLKDVENKKLRKRIKKLEARIQVLEEYIIGEEELSYADEYIHDEHAEMLLQRPSKLPCSVN